MHFDDDVGPRMGRLAEGLASIAPDAADRASIEAGLRDVSRLRSFCDAVEAALTPALEALLRNAPCPAVGTPGSDGAPGDGADACSEPGPSDGASGAASGAGPLRPPPHVPRESAAELARRLARARWLRRCEQFAAALLAGSIKGEHIDALGAVLAHVEPTVVADVLAEETRLLEVARRVGHVAFGRYVRDVVDRVRADGGMARLDRQIKDTFAVCKPDELTGMYTLFAKFDPIRGGEIAAMLQHRVDTLYQSAGATANLSSGQVVAKALHQLLCPPAGVGDDERPAGAAPGLLIVADARSFVEGEHSHTMCETVDGAPVPIAYARSLIATACITVAVAGDDGHVLNVGRSERLANWAQRFALRAMYRHCVYPGCRVPESQCHVHHVIPWEDGGPTDLGNLVPLCHRHHHQVHDEHWRLTIDDARTIRCYAPDGTLHEVVPFAPLVPASGPAGEEPTQRSVGAAPGQSPRDGPDPLFAGDVCAPTPAPRSPDRRGPPGDAPGQRAPQLFDPAA